MNKSILFFCLVGSLLYASKTHAQYEAQIKGITQELSKKIGETGKKRLAVADFTDADGAVTKLGQFISEEFNTSLPEVGQGFEVIDRSRINILIRENKISTTGLTDPTNALKLGKLAGIEALVYGTITPFGESVRVNIKILDLQRGVILRSVAGNITRTADINRLLSETVNNVISTLNDDNTTSDAKLPKPQKDCQFKPSCVLCVTNKSKNAIEVQPQLSNQLYGYAGEKLYVHPNNFKCWSEMGFSVSGDHDTVRVDVYIQGSHVKSLKEIIEPCKVYNLVYE
ncbi:FlgO family outer membrane protein [Runella salmonicolor]|uniref:CsgG/HfaB family protein n=1 Tax=Runella salmonicolor TaxID=2950278 RepID=A0ABT1FWT5_9BACT|nr:FlgO family outer membrane protein [Runella salmonicolor]MCP1386236.1 CsgG/HfaB family protein [Runella salmonicolor]